MYQSQRQRTQICQVWGPIVFPSIGAVYFLSQIRRNLHTNRTKGHKMESRSGFLYSDGQVGYFCYVIIPVI